MARYVLTRTQAELVRLAEANYAALQRQQSAALHAIYTMVGEELGVTEPGGRFTDENGQMTLVTDDEVSKDA